MTRAEFLQLQTPDSKAIIERYINQDSLAVAFKIGIPALSSQIKYLAKASSKLPDYYAARCIIDDIGYEQSSSIAAANSKFDGMNGELALDLTCGLGVDSYALSKRFKRVIAIEADELKADIARYNFSLLKSCNIEVVCARAEDFCANHSDVKFDLIYVDPCRVADGKRVFSIDDSSPNIAQLLPLLRKMSDKIVVKLSPMFDVGECFRIFEGAQVEAVSIKNECKEVLVRLGFGGENSVINTIINTSSSMHYECLYEVKDLIVGENFEPQYVHIPDVVFYKTRTVSSYISDNYGAQSVKIENYIFSEKMLKDFIGQSFRIDYMAPYNAKKIKQLGIKKATIHIRSFPYSLAVVQKQLGIKAGGEKHILLTTCGGVPTLILASDCVDCDEK